MGSAVAVANHELNKPSDASDITDKDDALYEVARLRVQISRIIFPLPSVGTWKHVLDAKTGHVYYWDIDSGSVLWNLPGMKSHHKVSKKTFRKKGKNAKPAAAAPAAKPAPTPKEEDFALAHKVFKDQARRAVYCVEQQVLRQKVLWEHEWHMELLDYTKELKEELAELARSNPLVAAAVAAAAADEKNDKITQWTSEQPEQPDQPDQPDQKSKKSTVEASMLKSTEDRANDAAERGRRNSETSLAQMHQARAERHGLLMAKLAGRRKRQLEKLKEKQEAHDNVVIKLQRALAKNTGRHGYLMKNLSKRLLMQDKDKTDSQTNLEITSGWVMLIDRQNYNESMQMSPDNVYFWHPEHGSQWERPDAMEFDMQLKHVFGHTSEAQQFADDLEAVDKCLNNNIEQKSSMIVEKWMVHHNFQSLQRKDSQLESEVMRLEDELAAVRLEKHGEHDAMKDL